VRFSKYAAHKKKEISLEKKKEIVRSYFSRLESRSSFSNIWDNKTSILLSKEENQTRSSLFYQYILHR
jgi:hypothetical protein